MASEPSPVTITILGKEYRVACPPEERAKLEASAHYLDRKMREVRDRGRGRTTGSDHVAIMAALNITHELLQKEAGVSPERYDNSRVKQIQTKIETALSNARQIEI